MKPETYSGTPQRAYGRKINRDIAEIIRKSSEGIDVLAKRYNLSPKHVVDIKEFRSWNP